MAEIEIKTINFFKFENSEGAKRKITPEDLENIFLYFLYWQMNKEKISKAVTQEEIDINKIKTELHAKLKSINKSTTRARSWEYKTFFYDKKQFKKLTDFFKPKESIKDSITYTPDDDPLYITFKIKNPPTLLLNFIIYVNSRKDFGYTSITTENINNNYDIYYGNHLKKILGLNSPDDASSANSASAELPSSSANSASAELPPAEPPAASTDEYQKIFNDIHQKYTTKDIPKDGHCFYRAVQTALEKDASQVADATKVSELRTQIADAIEPVLNKMLKNPKNKDLSSPEADTFFGIWAAGDLENSIPARYEKDMIPEEVEKNKKKYIDNIKATGKSSDNVSKEFWADELIIKNTPNIIEKNIVIINDETPDASPIIHYFERGTGEYIILKFKGGCHYDVMVEPPPSSSGSFDLNTLPKSLQDFIGEDSKKSQMTGGEVNKDTGQLKLDAPYISSIPYIGESLAKKLPTRITRKKQIIKNLFPFYISYENIFNTIPHQIITSNFDEKIKKYDKLNTVQFLPIINNYNPDEKVDKTFIKKKYKETSEFFINIFNSINIYIGIDSEFDKYNTQKDNRQKGGSIEPVVSPKNLKLNKKLYINYYKYILIKLYHNYRDEESDENNLFKNMSEIIITVADVINLLENKNNIFKLLETDSVELVKNISKYYYSLLNHFYTFNLPILLFYTIEQKDSNHKSYIYKHNLKDKSNNQNSYQNYEINENKVDEINNILQQILYYIQPIIVFNLAFNKGESTSIEITKQSERKKLAATVNTYLPTSGAEPPPAEPESETKTGDGAEAKTEDEPAADKPTTQIGGYGDIVENFMYGGAPGNNNETQAVDGITSIFTSAPAADAADAADADADAGTSADAGAGTSPDAGADVGVIGTVTNGIKKVTETVMGDSTSDTSEKLVKLTYYSASKPNDEQNLNDPILFLRFFNNYKEEEWKPLQENNLFKRNILKVKIDPKFKELDLENFIKIINFIKNFNRLPSLTIIINCNVIYSTEDINTYYKKIEMNDEYTSFMSLVTQLLYSGPPKNISFYNLLEEFKKDYFKEEYLQRFIFNKRTNINFDPDDKEYKELLKKYKLILEHSDHLSKKRYESALLKNSRSEITQIDQDDDSIKMINKYRETVHLKLESFNNTRLNISPLFLIKSDKLLYDSDYSDYSIKKEINDHNRERLKPGTPSKAIFDLNERLENQLINEKIKDYFLNEFVTISTHNASSTYYSRNNPDQIKQRMIPFLDLVFKYKPKPKENETKPKENKTKIINLLTVLSLDDNYKTFFPDYDTKNKTLIANFIENIFKSKHRKRIYYKVKYNLEEPPDPSKEFDEWQKSNVDNFVSNNEKIKDVMKNVMKNEMDNKVFTEKSIWGAPVVKAYQSHDIKPNATVIKGTIGDNSSSVVAAEPPAPAVVTEAPVSQAPPPAAPPVVPTRAPGRFTMELVGSQTSKTASEAKNKLFEQLFNELVKNLPESNNVITRTKVKTSKELIKNIKEKITIEQNGDQQYVDDTLRDNDVPSWETNLFKKTEWLKEYEDNLNNIYDKYNKLKSSDYDDAKLDQINKDCETLLIAILKARYVILDHDIEELNKKIKQTNNTSQRGEDPKYLQYMNKLEDLRLGWRTSTDLLKLEAEYNKIINVLNRIISQTGGSSNKNIQNKYQKTRKNVQENRKHKQTNKKQKKKKNMNIILKKKQKVYSKSRRNYKNIVKHKSSLHNIS